MGMVRRRLAPLHSQETQDSGVEEYKIPPNSMRSKANRQEDATIKASYDISMDGEENDIRNGL